VARIKDSSVRDVVAAAACSSTSTSAHRLLRSTRRHTGPRDVLIRGIFGHLVERGDDLDENVGYIADITDRFALTYADSL
jgi:hypothetical protein